MPELPEVECVRRTLEPALMNQTFVDAAVFRRDIITGPSQPPDLLVRDPIARINRHGKQLALVARSGRCVCIHLGMTGSLKWSRHPDTPQNHVHIQWQLADGSALSFRDPRRFGGIWTCPSHPHLVQRRWSRLGPDALTITASQLAQGLAGRSVSLKAALLNQAIVAGLGNIYVDELLFACRLSPLQPAGRVDLPDLQRLVRRMRSLLQRAIEGGGSTLRDYVDGNGAAGRFQQRHRVYGRGGQPCRSCRTPLATTTVAGRSTVHCQTCQPMAT